MIKLKELINRVYDGKECVRFEYEGCFISRFERDKTDVKAWFMQVVVPRTKDRDSQVYSIRYVMPKEGMGLAVIAAVGLKFMQICLKDEIQMKSDWDFALGQILKDM